MEVVDAGSQVDASPVLQIFRVKQSPTRHLDTISLGTLVKLSPKGTARAFKRHHYKKKSRIPTSMQTGADLQ